MRKMRAVLSSGILLSVSLLICMSSEADTLRIIQQYALDDYEGISQVLLTGGDSVMFLSPRGLFVRGFKEEEWHRLVEVAPTEEQVPFSVCDNDRLTRLVTPLGLWEYSSAGDNKILIYEHFCGRLYKLRQSEDGSTYLVKCDKRKGADNFTNTNVQNGVVLSGLRLESGSETVVVQHLANGEYRRVFRYPPRLARWRDSIGVGNGYMHFCDPALNPIDSTIWMAILGYNFLYVTDLDGNLLDSVAISLPDFRMPPRLRSRMKSDAVVNEWDSQWTYTTSFSYVSPGYFIMQYKTGKEVLHGKELGRFTTAIWDVKKRFVPLTVDPLWHVAGVQDDGRIIFVAPEADSSGCKETIIVTRIEP